MKECSSFSQDRKLVVIVVRGTFFIVEEVLSNCPPKEGPEKCPVNLRLPWIGNISTKFEN